MHECEHLWCKSTGEVKHHDEPVQGWYHDDCWLEMQQDYWD